MAPLNGWSLENGKGGQDVHCARIATGRGQVVLALVTENESEPVPRREYGINALKLHHHGYLLPGDYSLGLVASLMIPHIHGRVTQAHSSHGILHLDEDLPAIECRYG